MNLRRVTDLNLAGKRVLVRVDYNVPLRDGQVSDDRRLRSSFETINYLLSQGCGLVLMSHLGRPAGQIVPELSLAPVAARLAELLGRPVRFVGECVGPAALAAATGLQPGEILLLENLRFDPREEAGDAGFAGELAAYGDVYVDDAFGAIHRPHASVAGVPKLLPSAAGFLVEKEVAMIEGTLNFPDRPLVAVVGGAKIGSKIGLLNNLLERADVLMLGGAMANTFFAAQGAAIGKSLVEPDQLTVAKGLIDKAEAEGKMLLLPNKVVVSRRLDRADHLRAVSLADVEPDDYIVDAAPEFAAQLPDTISRFLDFNGRATVIWNGPLGIFEVPEFAAGSKNLAEVLADQVAGRVIVGGGDTAALVDGLGIADRFTWVSTGGGASLDLMAGLALPGLEVLKFA